MRITDPCRAGHEEVAVIRARHPLHQDRHLFVLPVELALQAVGERRVVHGAGVNLPHRLFERFEPLLRGSGVDPEDGFVFPRESVAETVFQQAA
ncbi:hypothetical protein SDC9_194748 [bioreactor metagenome]|uniref:Uncharacterized protein n=1 Tax=bioreactor metagenome TaxID=1076179 RepID=A0A645I7B1_9ZZZZ